MTRATGLWQTCRIRSLGTCSSSWPLRPLGLEAYTPGSQGPQAHRHTQRRLNTRVTGPISMYSWAPVVCKLQQWFCTSPHLSLRSNQILLVYNVSGTMDFQILSCKKINVHFSQRWFFFYTLKHVQHLKSASGTVCSTSVCLHTAWLHNFIQDIAQPSEHNLLGKINMILSRFKKRF